MAPATITKNRKIEGENYWSELYTAINSSGRMLGKFGWSDEVSAEYVKHLKKLNCDPARALDAFNDLLESAGEMPGFKEVSEKALQFDIERRWAFGQQGEHLDYLPVKIVLARKNPNDPHEPIRYAMVYCGCAGCRPSHPPTMRSKPASAAHGYWRDRADELAPQGERGFRRILKELGRAGNPMGSVKIGTKQ